MTVFTSDHNPCLVPPARGNRREFHFHVQGSCDESERIILNARKFMRSKNAAPLSIRIIGPRNTAVAAMKQLHYDYPNCPPLVLLQNDPEQSTFAIQVHALTGVKLRRLDFNGECVGQQFEDVNGRYLMLCLLPDENLTDNAAQSAGLFDKAHQVLTASGSSFKDVIRTWLYADDILSWYGQLNKVRDAFFEQHGIFESLIPASTGIGAANYANKALHAQVLALIPKNEHTFAQVAASPLQCPALDYRSSFSRAVELTTPAFRKLYVSGTASIDPDGKSVFPDDTAAQIKKTMQVVRAILDSAGMDWHNVVNSLVYFRNQSDFSLFDDYCRLHKIALPHIKLQADICRDDLLFELELEAMK